MAHRVAQAVVLPSICSAISFVHTASRPGKSYVDTDASFLEAIDANAEKELMPAALALAQTFDSPLPNSDCHDAVEGDWCYHSINWLREKGLPRHPDWYPTLQPSSSNSSIQAELHRKGKSDCPLPCGLTEEERGDADEDDHNNSTETVESMLEPDQSIDWTTQPELAEDDCRDAQPNTACYTAVTYAAADGIKAHPDLYKGLEETADFKTVQEYLYLQNRNGCERPCAQNQIASSHFAKASGDLREFREKKRIEDMNSEELSKYLDGKWDGYVSKKFKVAFDGETTSTFQRRSSLDGEALTTTTPLGTEEQEALPLINPEADAMTAAAADRYLEEASARRLLEEKMRMEAEERMRMEAAASATPARERKTVEDRAHGELSEYLDGNASVEPELPALGNVSTGNDTADDTSDVDAEALPDSANDTADVDAEVANGTEKLEALPVLSLENASAVEVPDDGGVSDQPMPAVDADGLSVENVSTVEVLDDGGISDQPMPAVDAGGNFVSNAIAESQPAVGEETPEEVERRMEMERQPHVETEEEEKERRMEMEQQPHAETPDEMERRIRAELMEKNERALKESEEDMRARIKAEVMYDLSKNKEE